MAVCVKVAGWWFWVLRCSMAKGGELGCLAHFGTHGHDFSPRPLFRYSFLIIECQIRIFEGVKDKKRGRKGRHIKSRSSIESEIPFACNSSDQLGQGINGDRKNR